MNTFYVGLIVWGMWTMLIAVRMLLHWAVEHEEYWRKPNHRWYTRVLCAAGIHLKGRSGQSSMHDITVCSHCDRDVLFVCKEDTQ